MNWEAIGAISEVVGTLAIVVSLVYVAIQIKQNSEITKINASQERTQKDFDIASSIIDSRDVAEIWNKSKSNFNDLDEVDQQRIILFERRAIVHWHNMFVLKTKNQLSESDWKELIGLIRSIGRNQGLNVSWNLFKSSFSSEFQNFIEEQIKAAS